MIPVLCQGAATDLVLCGCCGRGFHLPLYRAAAAKKTAVSDTALSCGCCKPSNCTDYCAVVTNPTIIACSCCQTVHCCAGVAKASDATSAWPCRSDSIPTHKWVCLFSQGWLDPSYVHLVQHLATYIVIIVAARGPPPTKRQSNAMQPHFLPALVVSNALAEQKRLGAFQCAYLASTANVAMRFLPKSNPARHHETTWLPVGKANVLLAREVFPLATAHPWVGKPARWQVIRSSTTSVTSFPPTPKLGFSGNPVLADGLRSELTRRES
jgi:hypothetical protein